MIKVNITMQIDENKLTQFENWLRAHFQVNDVKILPDTQKLYDEDETFRQLVKAEKAARKVKDNYINKHNFATH